MPEISAPARARTYGGGLLSSPSATLTVVERSLLPVF